MNTHNNGKKRAVATVAEWAARGVGFGWLVCAFFVRRIVESGGERYSEPQGLFHIPTRLDCALLAVGAIAGAIYAAVQLARGREP